MEVEGEEKQTATKEVFLVKLFMEQTSGICCRRFFGQLFQEETGRLVCRCGNLNSASLLSTKLQITSYT